MDYDKIKQILPTIVSDEKMQAEIIKKINKKLSKKIIDKKRKKALDLLNKFQATK
jgi:hypothetical protein